MIKTQPKAALTTQLELTPLIDIVFIVVVFLLLTANARLLALPVDIPKTEQSNSALQPEHTSLTLTLQHQSPRFAINQQTFDQWQTFESALTPQLQVTDLAVTIAADRNADVEPLLKLLALLNQHQISNTQILMEQQP
ncbi:biopolymer transporter ExbD [Neiella marina]|uniref:Biopolymer transporter ExbD n=1 Tax=Neiella holothuriorum TaxID=2870530 RepID=A0ABS7EGV8_9GAMM|nr:biopolymer transporter ExbD [Neiella holothuriorum]MBW8191589.1 biopolymer transporter ExbD [Neiella holothuriorum]